MGTYFGGMKAATTPWQRHYPGATDAMKLDPDPDRTMAALVRSFPVALANGERHKASLRRLARERYDRGSVARTFATELRSLQRRAELLFQGES